MDTACESLHHSFIIKYRWLNAGETLSRTLGNSCVSSVSSHRFTLPCIRLIVSGITTYGYELYLCYVRGEQLDKLCFSASHLIRYWKMYNYMHMKCLCILCIFWEIKHLNLTWTWTLPLAPPQYRTANFYILRCLWKTFHICRFWSFQYINIILSVMLKLCIPLCGLGFTWERVNPYMSLCLATMNQQNSGTTGLIGVRQAYEWRIS